MNSKIDWRRIAGDPLHIIWVVCYCGAGLGLLQLAGQLVGKLPVFVGPQILAAGMQIQLGIERFKGILPVEEWTNAQMGLLAVILVSYLIMPPLFVWGIIERAAWRRERGSRKKLAAIIAALGLSGPVLVGTLIIGIVGGPIAHERYSSILSVQKIGANRDFLIAETSEMIFKAQNFYHVPVELGGGGGRWKNIRNGPQSELQLEDVTSELPRLRAMLENTFEIEGSRWKMEVVREDSLVLWGVGEWDSGSPEFKNVDGQKGKQQVAVYANPRTYVLRVQN